MQIIVTVPSNLNRQEQDQFGQALAEAFSKAAGHEDASDVVLQEEHAFPISHSIEFTELGSYLTPHEASRGFIVRDAQDDLRPFVQAVLASANSANLPQSLSINGRQLTLNPLDNVEDVVNDFLNRYFSTAGTEEAEKGVQILLESSGHFLKDLAMTALYLRERGGQAFVRVAEGFASANSLQEAREMTERYFSQRQPSVHSLEEFGF